MAKHIVFIAVEVDDKYSTRDVVKELEYVIPFCSSELFDTLSGVYVPSKASNTYQVWSSGHIAMNADVDVTTYEELLAYEESTGYSYSSFVTTDDIQAFVEAVLNEFNGELSYHLVEVA